MRPLMEAPRRNEAPELGSAGPPPRPRRKGWRPGARWRLMRRRVRSWRPRLRKRDLWRFWAPLVAVCLLAVALAYREPIREAATQRAEDIRNAVVDHPDFAVRRIEISGRRELTPNAVLEALGLEDERMPLSSLAYDVAAARTRLLALPWIEEASVTLDPSGTLEVAIAERIAAAVWRGPDGYWLIDASGAPIIPAGGPNERLTLPYLVGEGANEAVTEARGLLFAAPRAAAREITALVRRGGRRWDAVSARGFIINLPADNPLRALRRYTDSRIGERIARHAVVALDLRRPKEPPVLRLAPGAADLRNEALQALDGARR